MNKTVETNANVREFIISFADTEQKRRDSLKLLELMQKFTGYEPKMWGESIIGFGNYHYKSENSRREGDWFFVGFSPRKTAISLYVFTGLPEHEYLLDNLGKFRKGQACIYIKKLSDINQDALENLMQKTINYWQEKYPSA